MYSSMDEYALHCTAEQTKKAWSLGAPVYILDTSADMDYRCSALGVNSGIPCSGNFDDYRNEEDYPNLTIFEDEDEVLLAVYEPTIEEMRGWLMDKGVYMDSNVDAIDHHFHISVFNQDNEEIDVVNTHDYKEAMVGAVDVALNYLCGQGRDAEDNDDGDHIRYPLLIG